MPFNFFAPADWLSSKINPTPTSLFQSRITQTPGGFMQQKQGVGGAYSDDTDPRQMALAAPDLSPEDRQRLAQLWAPLGKGVITLPPGQIDPTVMRHEQIHALQHNADLGQYANKIAGLIDPGLVNEIKATPVYQKEFQQFGEIPTIASEGSAFQLTQMPNAATTPALQNEIMQRLKTSIQQKQLQKLTQRPDQSQK